MGAAPLSWLAKIGGNTLKTKAKLLSSAINELYDNGQCKIVAVADSTADNGKTVLITTDDNKTYSGTIVNKKCEFLLPPKTLYTVQKVSSGSAEFTTKVEAGYGDYILVHLNTGHVEVKQRDIVGLDYIKAATADNLKNKVPEASAVKELNSSLGGLSFGVDEDGNYGYIKAGADTVTPFNEGVNTGTIQCSTTSPIYIKLGYKPSFISVRLYGQDGGQYQSMISTFTDINSQKHQRFYNTLTEYTRVCAYGQNSYGGFVHSIDDNGFYIQCLEDKWCNTDLIYMAMK